LESLSIVLIYELGPRDDGSFLGGIESHILGLAREFSKNHEVVLMTGMIPGQRRQHRMDGFLVERSDLLGFVSRSWDPTNLTMARQIFSLPTFTRRGVKRKADIYHGHVYASGLVALALGKLKGARSVNTIHGSYYDHWEEISGSPAQAAGYRLAERLLATFLARKCDRQIHTATDFADKVRMWGGPKDKMRVILNGVDTERFSPSVTPADHDSSHPVIMTIRRLVPKNGVRHLVEAAALIESPAQFLIVGDGPERPALEALSKDLRLENRVRFLGPVPNDGLPRVLAMADIVVVPSLVEASSISLLEAMSMGKPTIATNIPGIDEVASAERTLFVPPRDSRAIASALDILISDPSKRRQLGRKGRQYVLSQRSIRVVAQKTLEVYREALGG